MSPEASASLDRWRELLGRVDGTSRGLIVESQACPPVDGEPWMPRGTRVWEPVVSPEEPGHFDCLVIRDITAQQLRHDGKMGNEPDPLSVTLLRAASRSVRLGKPMLIHTAGRFADLKVPAQSTVAPFDLDPTRLLAGEELVYLLQAHCEQPVAELAPVSAMYLTPIERRLAKALDDEIIEYRAQVSIANYVVDFLIGESLVVECDGEAWHDPATDERRDASLRALGYQVLRFTGRSLVHSVDRCVGRIREAMAGQVASDYQESIALTDAQRRAASHTDGPALVVAPAGSGKTRVIEERVRWLVSTGVEPSRICVISFSNAAVDEVRARLEHLPEVSVRTLNSFGNQIVSDHRGRRVVIEAHRDPARPTRATILRKVSPRVGYRPDRFLANWNDLVEAIANYRTSFVVPSGDETGVYLEQRESETPQAFDARRQKLFLKIHGAYEDELREKSLTDFSGQIIEAIRILTSDWEARLKISARFDYWLIDEFQDLSPPQILLARMLAAPARNLMVVGDDDQIIYGFAGADPRSFSSLDRDWSDVTALPLDRNFRSPHEIVVRTRWMIERNERRIPKDTVPALALSSTPSVSLHHESNYAQAAVDEFEKLRKKRPASDFAFLFRTRLAAAPVELLLHSKGIAYTPLARSSLLKNSTAEWVLSWLRVVNDGDATDDDWRSVLKRPNRYLTKETVSWIELDLDSFALIERAVADRGASLHGLSPKQTNDMVCDSLAELLKVIDAARRFPDSLELQLRQLNLLETLENEQREAANDPNRATARPRTDGNLMDPVTVYRIIALMAELAGTWDRLQAFLDAAEHDADIDLEVAPGAAEADGTLTLSTIHRFKGKERPVLFVLGPAEGYMPAPQATSREAIEEERRVAYVAATRAQEMLYFWCSDQYQAELSARADGLTWEMYAGGTTTPPRRPAPKPSPRVSDRNPPQPVTEQQPGLLEMALKWLSKWIR